MMTKICPICNIEKSTSDFPSYFSKERQKYRIVNYCKPCGRNEAKPRAMKNYQENIVVRKRYAKEYRANTNNKDKIKKLSKKFKVKYREELKPCYLRDQLKQRHGFDNKSLHENPEIVEAYRLQLSIKRKLKNNGKE